MLKNFFLSTIRSITRQFSFTILNVVGLSVGMTVGLILLVYIVDESQYDNFHSDGDRTYRVAHQFYREGQLDFESARTFPKVGPALKADFPEVVEYCRLLKKFRGGVVRSGDINFKEEKIFYADPSFFSIFSFPLVRGDRDHQLRDVHTAVIEEATARKYFAEEDPVGKRITLGSLNGIEEYEITGVVRVPRNSHLQFSFLFSYSSLIAISGEDANSNWGWYDFYTYIKLLPGSVPSLLESKLPAFCDKYGGDRNNSKRIKLFLQPLADIHLKSHLKMEAGLNGDIDQVNFMGILALAVLSIAWINYINLSTARAVQRAKEVGLRKVIGSSRLQLITQFMLEAFFINFAALILCVALLYISMPFFSELTGQSLDGSLLLDKRFWILLSILFGFGAVISGSYPAFVISSLTPVTVLKGSWKTSSHGNALRKSLVVIQFVASVVMISGSIIIFRQIRFLQGKQIGADIERVVVITTPDVIPNQQSYNTSLETFGDEIRRLSGALDVSISSEVPGKQVSWYMGSQRIGGDDHTRTILYVMTVDRNYFDLFQIKMNAGRAYSKSSSEDSVNILLNKKAIETFGFRTAEEAMQQKIIMAGDTFNIIGVVEDYRHESAKEEIKPTAFRLTREEWAYFSVKVEANNAVQLVGEAKQLYENFFPGVPFNYFFLTDFYAAQYEKDSKFLKAFGVFAFLAIFVAALGLFGLASFMISQRTKEMSIRKVLGSSHIGIITLFSGEFLKLVLVANLVAVPVVLAVMNSWLSGFAHRTEISAWIFVVTAFLSTLFSILTISRQAMRVAKVNPAVTLKYE